MTTKLASNDVSCLTAPELTPSQITDFRVSLKMTQEEFAKEFDIPLGTLRRWEQGANAPRASKGFLRLLGAIWRRQGVSKPKTSARSHPHWTTA